MKTVILLKKARVAKKNYFPKPHFSSAVASPGFFSGGGGWGGATPRPLKAITRPPQGSGRRRPPDGSEVSFFRTMQSIWKWIEFSNISTFSCPKNLFFLRKISKNRTYLRKISEFFRIIIWTFSILMYPINPEKFSVNSIIWLGNLQWRRQEFFREGTPRSLEGYQAPPAGGPGAKAPGRKTTLHICDQCL